MKRKEARAEAMKLVFEASFRDDEKTGDIYARALELRDIEDDEYVKNVFFGVRDNLEFIDSKISASSNGWGTGRIAKVALASMRIAVYEMYFRDDVPDSVAINEAVESIKVYGDDDGGKVRKFANGVLNNIMKDKAAASSGDAEK